MKNITFLLMAITLFSCKKNDTITEPTQSVKWNGIYVCTNLTDDSTGMIVSPKTHLGIFYGVENDSMRLSAIYQDAGLSYFNNVLQTNIDLKISSSGMLNNNYSWNEAGLLHKITYGKMVLNQDNSIDLKYTESLKMGVAIRNQVRSYTGHFSK